MPLNTNEQAEVKGSRAEDQFVWTPEMCEKLLNEHKPFFFFFKWTRMNWMVTGTDDRHFWKWDLALFGSRNSHFSSHLLSVLALRYMTTQHHLSPLACGHSEHAVCRVWSTVCHQYFGLWWLHFAFSSIHFKGPEHAGCILCFQTLSWIPLDVALQHICIFVSQHNHHLTIRKASGWNQFPDYVSQACRGLTFILLTVCSESNVVLFVRCEMYWGMIWNYMDDEPEDNCHRFVNI